MPHLRWQGSLLIELHHTYTSVGGALLAHLALPATAEFAAQMRAASHTYSCAARASGALLVKKSAARDTPP